VADWEIGAALRELKSALGRNAPRAEIEALERDLDDLLGGLSEPFPTAGVSEG